ncbi:porin [Rhodobacterales bacterium HKCCSP123]|nr:porin [Rhodobacterales bacterium HKCCSP123]
MSSIAVHPVSETQSRCVDAERHGRHTGAFTDYDKAGTTRASIPRDTKRVVKSALVRSGGGGNSEMKTPVPTIARIKCGTLFFNTQFESSIFATTALVAMSGAAAAQDITLGGGAGAGIFYNNDNGVTDIYSSVDLEVTFSGSTDNGLTFGATIDASAGYSLDIADVNDVDFDGDYGDEDGTFGLGSIFISGAFGTLTFDRNGIDNVYNDDFSHDFSYEYDAAGFGVMLTYNLDASTDPGDQFSLELSYDGSDAGSVPVSAFLETDDSNEFHIGFGYDVTPELNIGLEYETDGAVTTLTAAYDNGMFSVDFDVNTDDEWNLGLGYSDQGFSIDVSTDEASEWDLIGSYDLGGGLSIVGGTAHTGNWYLGAAMSF